MTVEEDATSYLISFFFVNPNYVFLSLLQGKADPDELFFDLIFVAAMFRVSAASLSLPA